MSLGTRKLTALFQGQSPKVKYHNGTLLSGNIPINLYWYGSFTPAQRSIIIDFIASLSSPPLQGQPSVAKWWSTINNYYALAQPNNAGTTTLSLSLGNQILDNSYSLGKSLTRDQIQQLASKGAQNNAIVVVLTSADVSVERFCLDSCGTHGSENNKLVYIWVGNSQTLCPGLCAWPFHQPISGPQNPPLVPPNGDVGCDGMVINLASLLAGAITNPYGNGVYQGQAEAPLEAASACPGDFGKDAYPGFPGNLLVDPTSGGCYNAVGANGRKFLVPALFDPSTSSCSTLV
ncbi:hypothetical protein Vadar_016069 [Vaccinium darrowii]|uniref:Uncharacterized protein n=1 Tax=Vaccinium darrowii TaxID=229202 RepID=A0ACB7Y124_9ERIC|nr:hypothetical protein Vadar_016069 [Vaccinium darrowii]